MPLKRCQWKSALASDQSVTLSRRSKMIELRALSSQVKGGEPEGGRSFGTCTVRLVRGSPLCRCWSNRRLHSIACTTATNHQGTFGTRGRGGIPALLGDDLLRDGARLICPVAGDSHRLPKIGVGLRPSVAHLGNGPRWNRRRVGRRRGRALVLEIVVRHGLAEQPLVIFGRLPRPERPGKRLLGERVDLCPERRRARCRSGKIHDREIVERVVDLPCEIGEARHLRVVAARFRFLEGSYQAGSQALQFRACFRQ